MFIAKVKYASWNLSRALYDTRNRQTIDDNI